ncbi:MAG: TetR/AcrR family transcriptional regulator [Pseudomonadota bacterium]
MAAKQPKRSKASGPGEAGWQAQKSAATRDQILNAAVRCIVDLGYSNTTTMRIAERAGLSRGATLHHFPSKMDIIRAAVDFLHQKRLKAFERSVKTLPQDEDRIKLAVEAYWAHVTHPLFVAFFELSVAARTDKELADILTPAQKAFDEEWYNTAQKVFPEWQADREAFDLALNLCQQLMEGMAIGFLTHAREGRDEPLLAFLEDTLHRLIPKS